MMINHWITRLPYFQNLSDTSTCGITHFPGLLEPCSFPQAVAEAVYQVVDDAEVGAGGILDGASRI